jgi:antitoxin (DNA-binding transcriptional repressor) of toxin-antitoxin stability system
MYRMKRYTVALARARLAEALDEAEQGRPVIIERKGVRYRLVAEGPKRRRSSNARRSEIEILDPAVGEGTWTWAWTSSGLTLRTGRRRRDPP